ncbi:hypothetical protein VNO78_04910 [Psophocarpus tetragonolobus]|uniref:CRAL-TRIO domain-containing protein n=1 Tax=Psophocarpus tetragonolobus TaxID=3891 RepID=A0AAN9SQB2_PSOTE
MDNSDDEGTLMELDYGVCCAIDIFHFLCSLLNVVSIVESDGPASHTADEDVQIFAWVKHIPGPRMFQSSTLLKPYCHQSRSSTYRSQDIPVFNLVETLLPAAKIKLIAGSKTFQTSTTYTRAVREQVKQWRRAELSGVEMGENDRKAGQEVSRDEAKETVKKERKGIEELKKLVREKEGEEVWLWGVPLFKDDRTDVILLKFLRARELKVKEALVMIQNTLRWRKEFNMDAVLEEDLGDELDKVFFMHGHTREGHPVCYNVYGELHKYPNTEHKFLLWRIQVLERCVRNLDFSPGGICTIFQVNDLENSLSPSKRALHLLQDNYPEFVAKQLFINVPWWFLAFYSIISPFLTQRTKTKFVFAAPSKSPDTLFKYISPEQVPVQYGGLSVDFCDCNPDFTTSDPVTVIPIKPSTKQTVEIAIHEICIILLELRVVGWEVTYNAEFKPLAEDSYAVIIHKPTRISPTDQPVISHSFQVSQLGKLFLTIDNPTFKTKTLLYRFKIKPSSPSHSLSSPTNT